MAVDLARTFLEIVRCGSFVGAAERLHLTQAAITARVQSLKSQLELQPVRAQPLRRTADARRRGLRSDSPIAW